MLDLINYSEIAALIASIIAWKVIRQSNYMRLFPFLLFFIASGEIFGYYLAVVYKNNRWFYNFFTPAQYLFYFIIMYRCIIHKSFKKFILLSAIAYLIIIIISNLLPVSDIDFNVPAYLVGIFILIVCIIRKLYELLEYPERFDFLKSPFFYILFMSLVFNVASIPFFIMNNWMADSGAKSLITIFNYVFDILNILLYTTYTIAFLWMRKTGSYL